MSKNKTYVIERVATDVYEVDTEDGESAALFEVTRPFFEREAQPIRNYTEYRVFEKVEEGK